MHQHQRFRVVPHTVFPIGSGYSLVVSPELPRVIPVGAAASAVMQCCRGVQTTSQHVYSALDRGCPGDSDAVRAIIDAFVETGILQPYGGAPRVATNVGPTAITTVAIITADRPAALRRCLQSCVEHFRAFDRAPQLMVVDGSRLPQSRVANQASLARLDYARAIHVDAAAIDRIRARLALSDISNEALEFALIGGGTGANRNLALLLTYGEDLLMVDDDVVFDTWVDGDSDGSVSLVGHQELRHVSFHSSRADALNSVRRRPVDLLSTHSFILGTDLSEIGVSLDVETDTEYGCPTLLSMAAGERRGQVRVTFSGIAGDSGVFCPSSYLFDSGSIRAQLIADQQQFRTGMSSREIAIVASKYLVSHNSSCMAYCMGLSNRRLLPPFMPFGRNQDGLFGQTLSVVDPTALFGHVPVGIVHDSHRESGYTSSVAAATRTTMADVVGALTDSAGLGGVLGTTEQRIDALGHVLRQQASVDLQEFVDHTVRAVSRIWSASLAHAEAVADGDPYGPGYWREALVHVRKTVMESLLEEQYFVPPEFREDTLGAAAGFERTRGFVRRMGELYSAWPRMIACAADIRGVVEPER